MTKVEMERAIQKSKSAERQISIKEYSYDVTIEILEKFKLTRPAEVLYLIECIRDNIHDMVNMPVPADDMKTFIEIQKEKFLSN